MSVSLRLAPLVFRQLASGTANSQGREGTHQPRIYQGTTESLRVEPNFNPDAVALLKSKGHTITSDETMGSARSIMIEDGLFLGGADPRRPRARWPREAALRRRFWIKGLS